MRAYSSQITTDVSFTKQSLQAVDGQTANRAIAPQLDQQSIQTKPTFRGLSSELAGSLSPLKAPIQAKMAIGQAGDKYEQEADRIAARVARQLNSSATQTAQISSEFAQPNQNLLMTPIVQPMESSVAQSSSSDGGIAASDLQTEIQHARHEGQALPNSVREPMEQAFGADFQDVVIHTNTRANQLNHAIQSRAFTTGQDIFFSQGSYQPSSQVGQELLAHELTHVLQQRQGSSSKELIQRTLKVKMTTDGTVVTGVSISGDIDWRDTTKQILAKNIDSQWTELVDPETGAILSDPLHRRHKFAWAGILEALHLVLPGKDAQTVRSFLSAFGASLGRAKEMDDSITEDTIAKWCRDVYNSPQNLWIGPGLENSNKGNALGKAQENIQMILKEYMKSDEEEHTGNSPIHSTTYNQEMKNYKDAVFDPHYDEEGQMTPFSEAIETQVNNFIETRKEAELEGLDQYGTFSKLAESESEDEEKSKKSKKGKKKKKAKFA